MIPDTDIAVNGTPTGWRTVPFWSLFRREKKTGFPNEELLSVYRDHGVIPKSSRDDNHNKESEDLSGYQLVTEGALVTNKMKAWQGSIAISRYRGIVSPAYYVYTPQSDECDQFLHYLLRSDPYIGLYSRISKGVRVNQWDLEHEALRNIPVVLPDLSTQRKIADFLDRETARIDLLIEKKQRLVALLAEKIRAFTFKAVTQGISPSVPMKRSSLLYQETLPEHWQEVALGKKMTLQRGVDITKDEQNQDGQYPVISSGGISSYHDQFTCRGPGVLIGRKGSAGRLHYSESNFWAHDTTLYVKNFFGNDPKFAFYKLATIDLESFDRSSANPTINRNFVHPVKVSWTQDLTEQQEIVSSIERLESQIEPIEAATNASIDRLKEYRSALITAAVTGQIDAETYTKQGMAERQLDTFEVEVSQ